jgi:hypothetical protein
MKGAAASQKKRAAAHRRNSADRFGEWLWASEKDPQHRGSEDEQAEVMSAPGDFDCSASILARLQEPVAWSIARPRNAE